MKARSLSGILANGEGEDDCVTYKRVNMRSHTVEKRKSIYPHKPHASSQPSRFLHMRTFGVMRLQGCPFGGAWCLVCAIFWLGRLG